MQSVFVEVADEITTVIERLKMTPGHDVALVVPKGAVLLQSVVNLKLAKKAAQDNGKSLTLVTTDKIGRNLATQVGIPTVANLEESASSPEVTEETDEPKVIAGVKIHRYYDHTSENITTPSETTPAPIIPKPLLEIPTPKEEIEDTSPIVVRREITTDEPGGTTLPVVERIFPAGHLVAEQAATPPTLEQPTSKSPAVATPPPTKNRHRNRAIKFVLFLLVLGLIAAGSVSMLYLPMTVVTITVPSQTWSKDIPSTAVAGQEPVGVERLLAAKILPIDQTESLDFKSTGTKDIGTTATGTVEILNYSDSDQKTLSTGAKLTANGRSFITTADAVVPGFRRQNGTDMPGVAKVAITATDPGDAGNVNTPTVSIVAPQTTLSARNLSASGGSSKTVAVVTATDIANAKVALTKKLQDGTSAAADQAQGPNTVSKPDTDAFTVSNFASTVAAGDQATDGKATEKGNRQRLVVSQDGLTDKVKAAVSGDLAKGTELNLESVTVTNVQVDLSKGTATYTVAATGKTHQAVPLDLIRTQLTGKTQQDGNSLAKSLVSGAVIDYQRTPRWWPFQNLPYNARYIKVVAKNE